MNGLVEAARYNSRIVADLARLLLESEEVNAILFDAEVNSFYGGLFMPVRLMVLEDDLERAQAVLAEGSA